MSEKSKNQGMDETYSFVTSEVATAIAQMGLLLYCLRRQGNQFYVDLILDFFKKFDIKN